MFLIFDCQTLILTHVKSFSRPSSINRPSTTLLTVIAIYSINTLVDARLLPDTSTGPLLFFSAAFTNRLAGAANFITESVQPVTISMLLSILRLSYDLRYDACVFKETCHARHTALLNRGVYAFILSQEAGQAHGKKGHKYLALHVQQ